MKYIQKGLPIMLCTFLCSCSLSSKYDYRLYDKMLEYLVNSTENYLKEYDESEFKIEGKYIIASSGEQAYKQVSLCLYSPSQSFYKVKLIAGELSFKDKESLQYASLGFEKSTPITFGKFDDQHVSTSNRNKLTLSWISNSNDIKAKAYLCYYDDENHRHNIQFKYINFKLVE